MSGGISVFFSMSTGLKKPIHVKRGTLQDARDAVAFIEEVLGLETTQYLDNPKHPGVVLDWHDMDNLYLTLFPVDAEAARATGATEEDATPARRKRGGKPE